MPNPATITALNVATDPVAIQGARRVDVSLYSSSSFVGTVLLQRRRTGQVGAETGWRDVKSYTAVAEETISWGGSWEARLKCSAFTSGAIIAEVG